MLNLIKIKILKIRLLIIVPTIPPKIQFKHIKILRVVSRLNSGKTIWY